MLNNGGGGVRRRHCCAPPVAGLKSAPSIQFFRIDARGGRGVGSTRFLRDKQAVHFLGDYLGRDVSPLRSLILAPYGGK